jgi:voltage-gated potassium channel
MNPFRRLAPAGTLLLITFTVGVLGYVFIEGWTVLESVYMVVITLFTIGFGEVRALSSVGRVFTMVIAVAGVGTAVYAAGQAVEIIVEGEMYGYRKRRRMEKRVKEMKGHYVVCGFGRVGHQVAQAFDAARVPYVVIDAKPETAQELEPRGIPYIVGDATSDVVLTEAGIPTAKCLVACSDSDVSNVYITLSARALNPGLYIVARAGLHDIERKLRMAGADRVLSPYFISGLRMAALATRPVTSDFLDLVMHDGQVEFRLYDFAVSDRSPLIGKTLAESDIQRVSGATVLAIRRSDGSFDLQPRGASRVDRGDVLVVIGTQDQVTLLERML